MTVAGPNYGVSFWSGEFSDPDIERLFWSETWFDWSKITRYAALLMGGVLVVIVALQSTIPSLSSNEYNWFVVITRVVAILLFAVVTAVTFSSSPRCPALQAAVAIAMVGVTLSLHVSLVIYDRDFGVFVVNHFGLLVFIYLFFPNRAGYRLFNGAVMFVAFVVASHYATAPTHEVLLMPTLVSAGMNIIGFAASRWRADKLRTDFYNRLAAEQERTLALDDLRTSESEVRAILDNLVDTFYRTDAAGKVVMMSPSVTGLLGYRPDELFGQRLSEYFVGPNDREDFLQQLADGHGEIESYEARLRTKAGGEVWISTSARYRRDNQGKVTGVEGIVRNIADRKKAEGELRAGQQRYRDLLELNPDAIIVQVDGTIVLANQSACRIFGADDSTHLVGRASLDIVAPPQRPAIRKRRGQAMSEGQPLAQFEAKHRRLDGVDFSSEMSIGPINWDGQVGTINIIKDITERKQLENQLRQSQRLEAVGQLTGGIAHDFNNILAAIVGHLELLQDSDAIEEEFDRKGIATALRAALRGAELTHRLLAFSRQQELDAKVTEINQILPQFSQLAQRTIGEDIAIEMKLAANLWPTMVDAGQLENALLNLAINARDAMPNGGLLVIETANRLLDQDDAAGFEDLAPGAYVMISVSDTGIGMPAEVQERVFEPFFTTKSVGEGSGLGLSMVFGLAKQSGGHVSIYSEEGEGTTARIYLPRAEGTADTAGTNEQTQDDRPTGEETILVVEDDKAVRDYLAIVLRRLGYTVLEAEDGPAALEVMAAANGIDLLLTDVILPRGMSGRDVAIAFRERYPTAGVLYSSGYTREILNRRGQLEPGVVLMNKPYQTPALAQRVREVLDG